MKFSNTEFWRDVRILLLIVFTTSLLFISGLFITGPNIINRMPEQIESVSDETFEIELVYEYPRGCRYDLFSKTADKRVKVGYIRNHCKYQPEKTYLLSINSNR